MADGALLLYSLALSHPVSHVYIVCDSKAKDWLEKRAAVVPLQLQLHWLPVLDRYDRNLKRDQMVQRKIWSKFQMEKATAVEAALAEHPDTLFCDADIFMLSPVYLPNGTDEMQLGLSPHLIKSSISQTYGFYNGGFLWTSNSSLPVAWRAAASRSRFFDQAALEELARRFSTFHFGKGTNLGWYQMDLAQKKPGFSSLHEQFTAELSIDSRGFIHIAGQQIDSLHAHLLLNDGFSKKFNQVMLPRIEAASSSQRQAALVKWGKAGFPLRPQPEITGNEQPAAQQPSIDERQQQQQPPRTRLTISAEQEEEEQRIPPAKADFPQRTALLVTARSQMQVLQQQHNQVLKQQQAAEQANSARDQLPSHQAEQQKDLLQGEPAANMRASPTVLFNVGLSSANLASLVLSSAGFSSVLLLLERQGFWRSCAFWR